MSSLRQWLVGPVRSWFVSQAYALWVIMLFAVSYEYSRGEVTDFRTLYILLTSQSFWFGIFMAIVFGVGAYARAKQGADRVGIGTGTSSSTSKP